MSKSSQKMTQAELREFRSKLAKLKSKGLAYAGKDIRSQKPTRHALRTIDKFQAVLNGSAEVVTVPRGKGKQFEGSLARSRDKVVVPRADKADRSRWNKSADTIVTTRRFPGGTLKVRRGPFTPEQLRAAEGKGKYLSVYRRMGDEFQVIRADTLFGLAGNFGPQSSMADWSDWMQYVNIEEFRGDISEIEDEELEDMADAMPTRIKAPKRSKKSRTKRQRIKGRR